MDIYSNYYDNYTTKSIYYCDYSKPNRCSKNSYLNDSLFQHTEYIPIEFIDLIQKTNKSNIIIDKKVMIKKEIFYEKDGKIQYEKDY